MTDAPAPSEGTYLVRFRVGRGELGAQLAARQSSRHSPDLVARRDLERYYEAIRRALPTFSRGEAMAICDTLNGTLFDPWSVPLLWANVADGIRLEALDRKWTIDGAALVARLRDLSYVECLAVVDATERFWSYKPTGMLDQDTTEDALMASGLLGDYTVADLHADLAMLDRRERRHARLDTPARED